MSFIAMIIVKVCVTILNFGVCSCDSNATISPTMMNSERAGLSESVDLPRDMFGTSGRALYNSLIHRLQAAANPSVPPNANNLSQPVQVNISMELNLLQNLDTHTQVLSTFSSFQTTWRDESLSWNVTEYPVSHVFLDPSIIWRPQITIKEIIGDSDRFMKNELQVKVDHTGLVTWKFEELVSFFCLLFIRLFPFDRQFCTITLGSNTQSDEEVSVTMTSIKLPFYQHHQWDVIDILWTPGHSNNWKLDGWTIIVEVEAKRRWEFYLQNVLLPVLLVCGLNDAVLLLPVASGEKVSVSLTNFLTLAVFMTIVMDTLPSNSDSVCYLAVFLAVQMMLGVVAVVLSIIEVRCQHRQCSSSLADVHGCNEPAETETSPQAVSRGEIKTFRGYDQTGGSGRSSSWPRGKSAKLKNELQASAGQVINRYGVPVFVACSVLSTLTFFLLVTLTETEGWVQACYKRQNQ